MVGMEHLSGWFSANNHQIMRIVNRNVKRVATVLFVLLILFLVISFVGIRWGLTPLPKPPMGVRLEPLLPPLTRQDLKPDNAAYYYAKAIDLLPSDKKWSEFEKQLSDARYGDFSGNTESLEQTMKDFHEALNFCHEGTTANFCQMPAPDSVTNSLSFISPMRRLADLLMVEGKLAEKHGDIGSRSHQLSWPL